MKKLLLCHLFRKEKRIIYSLENRDLVNFKTSKVLSVRFIFSVLLVLLSNTVIAQKQVSFTGQSLSGLQKILHTPVLITPLLAQQHILKRPLTLQERLQKLEASPQKVPLVYAYKDLALFCKLEVKMEKAVKLPVKVRLGSADYVDWLEGKREKY